MRAGADGEDDFASLGQIEIVPDLLDAAVGCKVSRINQARIKYGRSNSRQFLLDSYFDTNRPVTLWHRGIIGCRQ